MGKEVDVGNRGKKKGHKYSIKHDYNLDTLALQTICWDPYNTLKLKGPMGNTSYNRKRKRAQENSEEDSKIGKRKVVGKGGQDYNLDTLALQSVRLDKYNTLWSKGLI